MKKVYKIEVDCPNCALKVEECIKKLEGVQDASVNFMALKLTVDFSDGADEQKIADIKAIYAQILADAEMVDWLNNTMLLESDPMTEEATLAHIENVKNIVNEYYDLVAE